MTEIGFWDYTCPNHGSLEHYSREDWDLLLDDAAEGGFNSFVLCVKWLTTGYRSRLEWLDQDPANAAIASDNATIHYALDRARQRGIRTWLLVVASIFDVEKFGLAPTAGEHGSSARFAPYDLDQPGLEERIIDLFDEVASLFGTEAQGMVVELEFCDHEAPHRVPIYNEWARRNGRPDFETIKAVRLEPRSYPFEHWRDFTTSRRIRMLEKIEAAVRGRGFEGRLASLAELENRPTALLGNVNLTMLRQALPHWALVTYDSIYDRRVNRLATMDFCIEQPRLLGHEVFYLTRGVMTWTWSPHAAPTTLPEQWSMALEDAAAHDPDGLWFMGSDARLDGEVCSNLKLPNWGFPDGRTARRELMSMAARHGLTRK